MGKVRSLVGRVVLRRGSSSEELARARKAVTEKNREIQRLREQLRKKDRDLAGPGELLDRPGSLGYGLSEVSESTPVFFVVGRAKSGTSWLMRMLDAHPEVLCKGEGRFFGRNFIREDLEEARKGRIQPSSLYRAVLEADYLRGWIEKAVWTRGDDVDEHLTNLTRLATNYFLTQRLAKSGKKIVGDKTPFLGADMIGEIGKVYPEARVIHIIRDGRDTAVSIIHHRWNNALSDGGIYELSPEEIKRRDAYREEPRKFVESGEGLFTEKMIRGLATGWKDQISRARYDGKIIIGDNYTEVRYEDLLEKPEEEARRLLRFLGADTDERLVKECVASSSFEQWTKGRKRGEEDSASFFRKGVAGDWKNVFTRRDREIFDGVAGDLLEELGYER